MRLVSVNIGSRRTVEYTTQAEGLTGIDKRPVDHPVLVSAPGPRGTGASGVAGDEVCDLRFHGGADQAVYAFAREELDHWERELGKTLHSGVFGENLTTAGIDLTEVLIGERWQVGGALLEATCGRIPCRTFAGWMEERGWMKRFTERGSSGVYFRVLAPGELRVGDAVDVVHRPDHEVTVRRQFRAVTTERHTLPELAPAAAALDASTLGLMAKLRAKSAEPQAG